MDEANRPSELDECDREAVRSLEEYNARFQPLAYRQVFYPLPDGGRVCASFPEAYFRSTEVVLEGVVRGRFPKNIHGVAAVFLSRHYLELALKYILYHSRRLKDERTNADDGEIQPVGKDRHKLKKLWDKLIAELNTKIPSIVSSGLDLKFVGEFVNEFDVVDPEGTRFRYPGDQLPVEASSREPLGISFDALLFDLKRAHDVLQTLDNWLIEQHGENQDWQDEVRSW